MIKSPRKQLRTYYAGLGITGSAARKPIASDMRKARANYADQNQRVCATVGAHEAWRRVCAVGYGIESCFVFAITPEGLDYWAARAFPGGVTDD